MSSEEKNVANKLKRQRTEHANPQRKRQRTELESGSANSSVAGSANFITPDELIRVINEGEYSKLEAITQEQVNFKECLNQHPDKGCFFLWFAARKGVLFDVRYLVEEQGVDPKTAVTDGRRQGQTPLFIAAANGHLNVVKYLVEEKGLDPKAAVTDGRWQGLAPLFIAASNGHLGVVKYLVSEQGVDPKVALTVGSLQGQTPLFIATANGHLDVFKYLVSEQGVDPKAALTVGSLQGQTPLFIAASNGHLNVVKYLVAEQGVDPKAAVPDGHWQGQTTLIAAAAKGHLNVVKYLVAEQGLEPTTVAKNEQGHILTPLFAASFQGHLGVVKYLVEEQGLDPKAAVITDGRWQGQTPLFAAAANGHLNVVKYLVAEQGLDPKAALTVGRGQGVTLLVSVAIHGHINVVKYLVEEQGLDPKAALTDGRWQGQTPLFTASAKGHLDVVKYFMNKSDGSIASEILKGFSFYTGVDLSRAKKSAVLSFLYPELKSELKKSSNNHAIQKIQECMIEVEGELNDCVRRTISFVFNLRIAHQYSKDESNISHLPSSIAFEIICQQFLMGKEDFISIADLKQSVSVIEIINQYSSEVEQRSAKLRLDMIDSVAIEIVDKLQYKMPFYLLCTMTDSTLNNIKKRIAKLLVSLENVDSIVLASRVKRVRFIDNFISSCIKSPGKSLETLIKESASMKRSRLITDFFSANDTSEEPKQKKNRVNTNRI